MPLPKRTAAITLNRKRSVLSYNPHTNYRLFTVHYSSQPSRETLWLYFSFPDSTNYCTLKPDHRPKPFVTFGSYLSSSSNNLPLPKHPVLPCAACLLNGKRPSLIWMGGHSLPLISQIKGPQRCSHPASVSRGSSHGETGHA